MELSSVSMFLTILNCDSVPEILIKMVGVLLKLVGKKYGKHWPCESGM